jgi:FAD/FMN-containing dehydrogenase/NAD-dependent dihydropyrimidine dehydrogenase PreA subunit
MYTEELKIILNGIKTIDRLSDRELYSHDIGDIPPFLSNQLFKPLPDIVVQPKNIDEIQRVLSVARTHQIPVIPRGSASWGLGGAIPTNGGIVVDLSPLRRILSMDTINNTVTVEAGARWNEIDIAARKKGLCLMTYPSSMFSTVGGWISTGGYGINNFKYGHISQQVLSIKVVTASSAIKQLSQADPEFQYFFSTEGIFGIITEVTLKLRPVPAGSYPHLLYFPSDKAAFEFIRELVKGASNIHAAPNFIQFIDATHLNDINRIIRRNIFEQNPAVLVEFSDIEDSHEFKEYLNRLNTAIEAPQFATSYLWNERLFTMKIKRLGPSILSSEIIMPLESASEYIEKAKRLGGYFGASVCINCFIVDTSHALVMSTFVCNSKKLKYYINLLLVSMLTQLGIRSGAIPYGLGIWNASFIHDLYTKSKENELANYKSQVDKYQILNPGKSISRRSGLSQLLFHPSIFKPAISLMLLLSPIAGKLATILFGHDRYIDNLNQELSLHACAQCGNCIAVCPAYLITHNELTTAKGKIALAKKLSNNAKSVTREEAANAFLCLHCKACERVCETNLELMQLWDVLEKSLESRFSRPENQINDFIVMVENSPEYWNMVEMNS